MPACDIATPFRRVPGNCTAYYHCISTENGAKEIVEICEENLLFNPDLGRCDAAEVVYGNYKDCIPGKICLRLCFDYFRITSLYILQRKCRVAKMDLSSTNAPSNAINCVHITSIQSWRSKIYVKTIRNANQVVGRLVGLRAAHPDIYGGIPNIAYA